jgi:membrane-bound ClpP family serine protease
MWFIAGLLLGIVVLATILGFHVGPHSHAIAGAAGVIAAVWLIVMAATGQSSSLLWALFTADLLVSAGVGILAWRALTSHNVDSPLALAGAHHGRGLEGAQGVVVSELGPEGVVRVRGEQWTAVAAEGKVPAGEKVRVLSVDGMRLEVIREQVFAEDAASPADPSTLFSLEVPAGSDETSNQEARP